MLYLIITQDRIRTGGLSKCM